jgi:hypothetical protein
MAAYKQDIFETHDALLEPVLREQRYVFLCDDASAVAEAIRHYDVLAKEIDRLDGFVLYDRFRVVHECPRRTNDV